MKLEHLAIWVQDLEIMRTFYQTYFAAGCSEKYLNPKTQFASYFISFGENGARIELMMRPGIEVTQYKRGFNTGLAHLAISVGGREKVDDLTERLRGDHYSILSEPRTTGDGYYESAVLDPEGNYIEITS